MPRPRARSLTIALLAFTATTAGCGEKEPRGIALSGRVTYQGELVSEGYISFLPSFYEQNRGANAEIRNGRFSIPSDRGPYPGNFRVSIVATNRANAGKTIGAAAGVSTLIPPKYNNESELEFKLPDRKAYQLMIDLK